jgi:Pvc16 N-terminal domain
VTLDLSAVTDSLIGLVKNQWATAPIWGEIGGNPPAPTFTPTFTGLAPDALRAGNGVGPALSMYLYHVESDNATESLFWQPQMLGQPGGSPTRFLPQALDLFYLLFAYSEGSYAQEHEAMSVALRTYHDNPIVRSDPGVTPVWELSLTMEHRSYDELSRLWQATTAPLRMSVVYRAAVVFIDAPDTMPDPAPKAKSGVSLGTSPIQLPLAMDDKGNPYPVVFGSTSDASYVDVTDTEVTLTRSPAVVAPSQILTLSGAGLGTPAVSDSVYLLSPGGAAEVDVTTWAQAADSTPAKFALTLPNTTGAPPAAAPAPGVYQVRVGSGQAGSPGAVRTGATPLSVAAYVNPTGGPVLSGAASYTVNGIGFVPGATEVFVGTVALTSTAGAPTAGQVNVAANGTSFQFAPPAATPGTVLPIRVLVNGIESNPALWVKL